MNSSNRKKLIKFMSDLAEMEARSGPVYLVANSKPYEMTFVQFCKAWEARTYDVILDEKILPYQDPMAMLEEEHESQVLDALEKGYRIPQTVLKEYRFKLPFFKKIRRYCNVNNIDLDE